LRTGHALQTGHALRTGGGGAHRVAIAISRLVSADETSATFRWRDYRHGNAPRLMKLDGHEFVRRFLLHSLPDGFHRIRHHGFLPMVAGGCGTRRSGSFCPTPKRLLQRQTTPPHRHDPSGSIRQSALVVAGPCASSQRYRADGPGHYRAGLIRHEYAMPRQHGSRQRRGFNNARRSDRLYPPWCQTTRPASTLSCSRAHNPQVVNLRTA